MLKEALKWIADHTGISWILGKFSSGWKWLFGSKKNTTINPVQRELEKEQHVKQHDQSQTLVNEADNYLEVKDKRLYLNLTKENFEKCENYHNSNNESAFFNKEYGRNKFRMYIKHDEKGFRIIGTPDGENCRIDIDLIIERNNSVNDKGKEVRFSIHKAGNVQLSHGIGVTAISKKNGSILNMVETALQGKIAVKVSNEPFVGQTTTQEQSKVSNGKLVGATQPATPEQPIVQNHCGCYLGIDNNNLVLTLAEEDYTMYKDCKHPDDESKVIVYVQRGKDEYRIIGTPNDKKCTINVSSVLKKTINSLYNDGNILYVNEDIVRVRKVLKFSRKAEVTAVHVSTKPFAAQTITQEPNTTAPKAHISELFTAQTTTQEPNTTAPRAHVDPAESGHLRVDGNNLVLILTEIGLTKRQDYINPANAEELCIYIQCEGEEYRITGILDGDRVNVNSIVEVKNGIINEKDILCPANHMETIKAKFGLLDEMLVLDCIISSPTASQQQQEHVVEEDGLMETFSNRSSRTASDVSEYFDTEYFNTEESRTEPSLSLTTVPKILYEPEETLRNPQQITEDAQNGENLYVKIVPNSSITQMITEEVASNDNRRSC